MPDLDPTDLIRVLRADDAVRAELQRLLLGADLDVPRALTTLAEAQRGTEQRLGQLTERVEQLADGMIQLTARVDQLTAHVDQLADGVVQLTERVDQLTDGLTQLTERVDQLTDGLTQLTERVDQLTDGLTQLTERVDQLTDGLTQLTERVDQLTRRVDQLAQRMDELADRMGQLAAHTEELAERMDRMADGMAAMAARTAELSERLDAHRGWTIERKYVDKGHTYFQRLARRLRVLSPRELDEILDPLVEAGTLTDDEAEEVRAADAVFRGRLRRGEADGYLVVEVSVTVDNEDVYRVARRTELLLRAGKPVVPVVAGEGVTGRAARAAKDRRVWQVTNGTVTSPDDPSPAALSLV